MIVSPDIWLSFLAKKHPEDQRDKINLTIYGCLVGASFIFAIIRAHGFLLVSLRCSERLHDKMVLAILQAPVFFFDSNPVGRIMNRFSKDVGCMDEVLPKTFLMSIQMALVMLTGIFLPTVTNPWLLFIVLPLVALVVYISRYYLKTSRELKRLESICRSPVFSHVSETLNGLGTIRTRGRQREFTDQFYRYCNSTHQSKHEFFARGTAAVGDHACVHACMRACLHACMLACVHACMPACLHACMLACLYALHACMLARVRACIQANSIFKHQGLLVQIPFTLLRS